MIDNAKVLSAGAVLHVEKCLVVDEDSEIVVAVEENNAYEKSLLLATCDANCSSTKIGAASKNRNNSIVGCVPRW